MSSSCGKLSSSIELIELRWSLMVSLFARSQQTFVIRLLFPWQVLFVWRISAYSLCCLRWAPFALIEANRRSSRDIGYRMDELCARWWCSELLALRSLLLVAYIIFARRLISYFVVYMSPLLYTFTSHCCHIALYIYATDILSSLSFSLSVSRLISSWERERDRKNASERWGYYV